MSQMRSYIDRISIEMQESGSRIESKIEGKLSTMVADQVKTAHKSLEERMLHIETMLEKALRHQKGKSLVEDAETSSHTYRLTEEMSVPEGVGTGTHVRRDAEPPFQVNDEEYVLPEEHRRDRDRRMGGTNVPRQTFNNQLPRMDFFPLF